MTVPDLVRKLKEGQHRADAIARILGYVVMIQRLGWDGLPVSVIAVDTYIHRISQVRTPEVSILFPDGRSMAWSDVSSCLNARLNQSQHLSRLLVGVHTAGHDGPHVVEPPQVVSQVLSDGTLRWLAKDDAGHVYFHYSWWPEGPPYNSKPNGAKTRGNAGVIVGAKPGVVYRFQVTKVADSGERSASSPEARFVVLPTEASDITRIASYIQIGSYDDAASELRTLANQQRNPAAKAALVQMIQRVEARDRETGVN